MNKILLIVPLLLVYLQMLPKNPAMGSKLIKYSASIVPPGSYQIAIWDKFKDIEATPYCKYSFEKVEKEDFHGKKHWTQLLKYYPGIELEHFNHCFSHFYTAQTNEHGEFEVYLSDQLPSTIFFQIFPFDMKNMCLIRSDSSPAIFLQTIRRKADWRIWIHSKQQLFFYTHKENHAKIGQVLQQNANANSSGEEAFFLKAYLQEIASRIVELFTVGADNPQLGGGSGALTNKEVGIIELYGRTMQQWQTDGILGAKLAQIVGMTGLVHNLCRYTVVEQQSSTDGDGTVMFLDKCIAWQLFCTKFIHVWQTKNGQFAAEESLLTKLNIAQLEEEEEQ